MKKDYLKPHLRTATLCVLTTILLSFSHVVAKAQQISLHKKNISVEELLNLLRAATDHDFIYTKDMMTQTTPIDIDVEQASLNDVLALGFKNQPLIYTVRGKTIVIRPRPTRAALPNNQRKINGYVKNEKGTVLPGVSITLMKDGKAYLLTVSASDGFFEFPFVADASALQFSNVGYDKQTIAINKNNRDYQVTLVSHDEKIDEVVVTGIFNRPVENFTGSATTIKGEDLKKVSTVDIFKSVAAMDPAFNITVNNVAGGNINQTPQVQIRGQNSFPTLGNEVANNPNQPLFILDGFEVTIDRIQDLDINLISTVVLLKDASATSIYGSRGANGVMVVNTKIPEPGKLQISLTNDLSISTPDLSVYNLLDARQKLDYEQRLGMYNDEDPNVAYALNQLYNSRMRAVEAGINTDWRNLPVQAGINNRTSLSITGGDSVIRYGINGGTNFQNGVMKGQDRSTYQAQFDFAYTINKLRFSNSARFYQTTANESPYGSFSTYLDMNPYWSPYDENNNVKYYLESFDATGDYAYSSYQTNPLYNASLGIINRNKNVGIQNNLNIRYDVLPSLFIESKLGITKETSTSDYFLPGSHTSFESVTDASQKGSYTKGLTEQLNYEFATYLNYRKNWKKHLLFSTFSFELGSNQSDGYSVTAVGFATDNLDHLLYATQYQPNSRPTGAENTNNRVGLLLNGNYSYDNRYLLDVSIRRDGSSLYGTERKFGDFWSVGMGWNLHNEKFFKDVEEIDRLRIRTNYGATGSLAIPAYTALTQYSYSVANVYDGNLGVSLSNIGNPNLGWQQKNEWNLGADIDLMKTRLTLRADYYYSITSQAITPLTLAPSVGASSYYENFGKISNRGIEFAFQYKLVDNTSKNFFWTVFANGLHNKNTLLEISNNLLSLNNSLNEVSETIPNFLYEEGKSTTAIFAVPSLGIDPATGREIYHKKDGSSTFVWSADDKVAYGDTSPKWQGSFGTNVFYKGFELGVIMSYRWGGQIFNQTLVDKVENIDPFFNVDARAYEQAWAQPGDVTIYRGMSLLSPQANAYTYVSTRFIEDDNNLSFTSLSLGYLFTKQAFVKKMGFNSLRVRALTNEVAQFSSVLIERGTANPFARTYSLSLNASF